MFQSWNHITFLHWRYDAARLQERLPPGLEIESFDGSAWVSLTPFVLENLRPPFLPALPWLSHFPEMNLRTYVNGPQGSGIWFFALDAARLPAVVGARLSFGLPYYWSDMSVRIDGNRIEYYSSRGGSATAHVLVETGGQLDRPRDLDIFLTARFRLYAIHAGRLGYCNVEHPPWPLRAVTLKHLEESVRRASYLETPESPVLTHHSPGVHVRVGRLLQTPFRKGGG